MSERGKTEAAYAVVREAFDDITMTADGEQSFSRALEEMGSAWCRGDPDAAQQVRDSHPQHEELAEVLDGLRWIRFHTDIRLTDIRLPNVGQSTRSGQVGMRDMSRGAVPFPLQSRVRDRRFTGLWDLIPLAARAPMMGADR